MLERSQHIPRGRNEVYSFFEDATNLARLTPPYLGFRILTQGPIVVREGALIDYRISLFGLPLTWRTRIDVHEPPVRFVDRQLDGPYRLWLHTHEFHDDANGTLMTDRVEYALPFGVLGRAIHALFVRRTLNQIFDYRRDYIAKLFDGHT